MVIFFILCIFTNLIMQKIRKRHRRYKQRDLQNKYARHRKFTKKYIKNPKTGFSHGLHDFVRSGACGPLMSHCEFPLLKKCRCPPDCLICGGEEPGCPGGKRTENKHRIYQESVKDAEERLLRENAKYEKHLVFFRTLEFLCYLRTFTFSSGYPGRVFFSLYDENLSVQRNPQYPVEWVAFQNRLDSFPFLTWKREKRKLVFSARQIKTMMCIGGSTRFLAMQLVSSTQKCRSYILRRIFGKNSLLRLIQAGGLDKTNNYDGCLPQIYFGE